MIIKIIQGTPIYVKFAGSTQLNYHHSTKEMIVDTEQYLCNIAYDASTDRMRVNYVPYIEHDIFGRIVQWSVNWEDIAILDDAYSLK